MANIKNGTNRFMVTKSQEHKFSIHIAELPEAKGYRKDLEPLLGAAVKIQCSNVVFIPSVVDGKDCFRVLLRNAEVISVPKSRGIEVPFTISHIWTILDCKWKDRNDYVSSSVLRLKGFLYLYKHHGKKNIGFQAFGAIVV